MPVLVIYNPVCGDGTAQQFFDQHVIPYLKDMDITPTAIMATGRVGHAGTAVINFLANHQGDVTVILGSGDGTLHEIINAMASDTSKGVRGSCSLCMVLVPCGTANALYASFFPPADSVLDPVAYKLQSLKAFASGSTPKALTLAFTSLSGSTNREPTHPEVVVSAVVTSTALHATILDDSENLRQQYPGIERFKIAAQQNITRWYTSHVKLLPLPSSGVLHIYDPESGIFVSRKDSDKGNAILDLCGPFAYFVSTVNVDRLEPAFRICPMISERPHDPSLDVIIIRPGRNPAFTSDTPQAREDFAKTVFAVLMEVYRNGNHINLRYKEDGDTADNGSGPVVVEYFRCGGWEWIPDDADERAHLLCSDGAIFRIDQGGRAVCTPRDNTAILVYV